MPTKTRGGISSGRLLSAVSRTRSTAVGRWTTPGSQPTTAVSPSLKDNPVVVLMRTEGGSIATVASLSVEP